MNLFLLGGLNLTTGALILLIICLLAVCVFEFVNGFHDTANAVATVIYTHSLRPTTAVVLSGVLNFLGVILGGLGVAMGILKILPLTELMYASLYENVAFLLGVLLSAIIWNIGTWYLGLPASSSHTLIGALVGASLVFGSGSLSDAQTIKVYEILTFLVISPFLGFMIALFLLKLMRKFVRSRDLYEKPKGEAPPPMWVRILIILGCVGVSFSHGSNDGQKGVGLMLVVLIAFLPAQFALVPDFNPKDCLGSLQSIENIAAPVAKTGHPLETEATLLLTEIKIARELATSYEPLTPEDKKIQLRKQLGGSIPKAVKSLSKKSKEIEINNPTQTIDNKALESARNSLKNYTDFAPQWSIILISLCLGLGTMVGWKRIVETIGEKIGKSGFDYSQGLISQFVSSATIFLSTALSLPVSTTHIVSSSVMGTMFAKGGKENIQRKTVVNIALAWGLTLPVCIGLSAFLYWLIAAILV